ncbi:MAG: PP2C family protein-serine/threonine phosphatase [Christensenellales bacterium]|jgi:serine/threonine protein phosphatase PrpC
MRYLSRTFSHTGGREGNEDAFLCLPVWWAVADGLGGHERGEEASLTATEELKAAYHRGQTPEEAFNLAQKAVCRMDGPRTTLVLAAAQENTLRFLHLGDSRGYLFRDGRLLYRTVDDSLPQKLVQLGEISSEEIRRHPLRNRLTAALGGEDIIAPHISFPLQLTHGDALLLVSDGFWEPVTEARMLEALAAADGPEAWIMGMLEGIDPSGAEDNLTAVAVFVLAEGMERNEAHGV